MVSTTARTVNKVAVSFAELAGTNAATKVYDNQMPNYNTLYKSLVLGAQFLSTKPTHRDVSTASLHPICLFFEIAINENNETHHVPCQLPPTLRAA